MSLNWADWTIVAIIGVSCVLSLLRGFVKEMLSLASWAAASFVAITFHERLAIFFSKWIHTPSIRTVLAFAALFMLTLLIGTIINKLVQQFVVGAGLGGVDRGLGMVFGVARGLLIVLALVILLPMVLPELKQDSWWHQSRLLPYFEASENWARETFGELFGWSKSLAEKVQAAKELGRDNTDRN
jgi:membrane protein required for colicin V production